MDQFRVIKLLSDETRFQMFMKLMDYDELYVTEFVDLLHLKQANASKHLKKLRESDVIEGKRDKNIVRYHIKEDFLENNLLLIKYLSNIFQKTPSSSTM
ncbi:MAG: metalloregulator ArsR/SmtB family transcription factor [Candidatus Izimaplasma sp.]|nr:metalloregulator ArsR/SmtB family transcription factor [Candidatus Izimaplasma bacterium]